MLSSDPMKEVISAFSNGNQLVGADREFIDVASEALLLVGGELASHLERGEDSAAAFPVGINWEEVTHPGAVLFVDHQVVLAWHEQVSEKPESASYDLSDVSSITSVEGDPWVTGDTVAFEVPEGTIELVCPLEPASNDVPSIVSSALRGSLEFSFKKEPQPEGSISGFDLLAVRTVSDGSISLLVRGGDFYRGDFLWRKRVDPDGLLFPRIAASDGEIEPEPDDGNSYMVVGKGFTLKELGKKNPMTLTHAGPDVYVEILVTESRVVVSCREWNKSRGWVGFGSAGILAAAAITAGDRILESRLRNDTLLVGHVRYNWLQHVAYRMGSWPSSPTLIMTCRDGFAKGTRTLSLELPLESEVAGFDIADDIVGRASKFWVRLGMNCTNDELEQFQRLAVESPRLPEPQKKKAASIFLPTSEKVHWDTVRTIQAT